MLWVQSGAVFCRLTRRYISDAFVAMGFFCEKSIVIELPRLELADVDGGYLCCGY